MIYYKTHMNERIPGLNIPILTEAAGALKQSGKFNTDLSPEQIRVIMASIIDQLIAQQAQGPEAARRQIAATISDLRVAVEEPQAGLLEGVVNGRVNVTSPENIALAVDCRLGNSTTERNQLELRGFNIGGAGFLDRIALGTWQTFSGRDLRAEGIALLSRPNQAFGRVLKPAFATQGVNLTGLGLHFNPGSLAMALSGETIPLPPPPPPFA